MQATHAVHLNARSAWLCMPAARIAQAVFARAAQAFARRRAVARPNSRTQGYGLTETCGASMLANPYDINQQYTIGTPVAGLLMRLESIPDMGYDACGEPARGELLLKGRASSRRSTSSKR